MDPNPKVPSGWAVQKVFTFPLYRAAPVSPFPSSPKMSEVKKSKTPKEFASTRRRRPAPPADELPVCSRFFDGRRVRCASRAPRRCRLRSSPYFLRPSQKRPLHL